MATVGSLVVEMGMDIARLQSDVTKARVSLDNVDKSVVRMGRSFEKLTNIYEYANTALKRMQSLLTGMAFGLVIGMVSELTSGIMKWWQEMNNAEEIGIKLRDTILNQAQAWKILPIELDKTTESTIRLYNANLKVLQLEEANKGENLRKKIENLEAYRNKLETNVSFMTMFGEVIGDNTLSLAKNQAALEKARAELERWDAIQKMQPTTLEEVTKATSKQTEELLKQRLQLDEHVEAYQRYWDKINNMKAIGEQTGKPATVLPTIQLTDEDMKNMQIVAEYFDKTYKQRSELVNQAYEMADSWNAYFAIQAMIQKGEGDITAYQAMQWQMRLNIASTSFRGLSNLFNNFYIATSKKYSALFEIAKAFAIAETIVNTYKDATAGAAALSGIPIIGPALATAYRISAIAAGAAAVAQIMSAEPGAGAGMSIPTPSAGAASGGYSSAYQPTGMEPTQEQLPSQNITINVYNPLDGRVSEEVADAIIRAINEAPNRNITINAQAVY